MNISLRKNKYMYSYSKSEPPELRLHLHNYYEFLYFKSGSANYMVENTLYQALPGDLFITRPDEIHTITFHSNDTYERHFIQIAPDYLNDLDVDLLSMIKQRPAGTMNRISADIVKSYEMGDYFTEIEQYVVNRMPESDILIKTYIIQMLTKINSFMREYCEEPPTLIGGDRVTTIKQYIDKHIKEDLSLEFLCEHFYISKYHLCRTFKNCTGLTIKEYINTRRITTAKKMIFDGCNITSVCYECGFKDYSNFYRNFKKFTNKSPREFFKSF